MVNRLKLFVLAGTFLFGGSMAAFACVSSVSGYGISNATCANGCQADTSNAGSCPSTPTGSWECTYVNVNLHTYTMEKDGSGACIRCNQNQNSTPASVVNGTQGSCVSG